MLCITAKNSAMQTKDLTLREYRPASDRLQVGAGSIPHVDIRTSIRPASKQVCALGGNEKLLTGVEPAASHLTKVNNTDIK
jgi:hypothetical protein